MILWGTLATLLMAAPAPPQPKTIIAGEARVIDGDTLVVGRVHVRLWGVDSPELGQKCQDERGRPNNCGDLAASVLEEEIGGATVLCTAIYPDRFRRIVATCSVSEQDLGERMVRRGYARDYPFYSRGHYAKAEEEARRDRRGLWAGVFQDPWDWRRENRR